MTNTTIICPGCKYSFEISDAIQAQISDELQKAKTQQTANLRKEYESATEQRINLAVQSAVAEATQAAELKLAKERQNTKLELDKTRQLTELELESAKQSATLAKESEKLLRQQLKAQLEEISAANKAREDAELTALKNLLEKEKVIRQEATQKASEDFNTKIREQEETINKLREQLTTAKQVAEQGSQQLQGEILELDTEENLRTNFPYDGIMEVKKGERGSDIRQVVNEPLYQNCGLILWECKNAKTYQASWLAKLKDELIAEKAQMGVIVFSPTDGTYEDFKQLADNIWLVKPRHAIMLATLLREVCIKVFIANRNAEGKDVKVEMIYNYLTGGEFSNRIRYILESHDEMARQLDAEKKQTQKRWATQEKILQKAVSSLIGISGDLQGISGQEIVALPEVEVTEI